jgi:hypothetical protein
MQVFSSKTPNINNETVGFIMLCFVTVILHIVIGMLFFMGKYLFLYIKKKNKRIVIK